LAFENTLTNINFIPSTFQKMAVFPVFPAELVSFLEVALSLEDSHSSTQATGALYCLR